MMSAGSFAAQAKANPSRYYRRPGQVVRDRRLTIPEKVAILEAWELEAREMPAEDDLADGEPSLLEEVAQARLDLDGDAGAPVKYALRRART